MNLRIRLIGAVLVTASAAMFFNAAPVRAQDSAPNLNLLGAIDKPRDPEAEERAKQIDDRYKSVTKSIQAPAQPVDPWGGVREPAKSTAAPKKQAGAKPAQ